MGPESEKSLQIPETGDKTQPTGESKTGDQVAIDNKKAAKVGVEGVFDEMADQVEADAKEAERQAGERIGDIRRALSDEPLLTDLELNKVWRDGGDREIKRKAEKIFDKLQRSGGLDFKQISEMELDLNSLERMVKESSLHTEREISEYKAKNHSLVYDIKAGYVKFLTVDDANSRLKSSIDYLNGLQNKRMQLCTTFIDGVKSAIAAHKEKERAIKAREEIVRSKRNR